MLYLSRSKQGLDESVTIALYYLFMRCLHLHYRVTTASVCPAGRGSSVSGRPMNVHQTPVKITPPVQTSSTLTGGLQKHSLTEQRKSG